MKRKGEVGPFATVEDEPDGVAVRDRDVDASTRLQHTGQLGQFHVGIRHVFQTVAEDRDVERRGGKV